MTHMSNVFACFLATRGTASLLGLNSHEHKHPHSLVCLLPDVEEEPKNP